VFAAGLFGHELAGVRGDDGRREARIEAAGPARMTS